MTVLTILIKMIKTGSYHDNTAALCHIMQDVWITHSVRLLECSGRHSHLKPDNFIRHQTPHDTHVGQCSHAATRPIASFNQRPYTA